MRGMVVAPHSLAVEEGVKVLRGGGNAVDAALTTAFVQCVVGVGMCGVAGFGSMHVYMSDSGEEKIIDFHGKAGSKAKPDIWEDLFVADNRTGYGVTVKGRVNEIGYQSITVSGTIRAFHEAATRYGTIEWRELIEPAISYAEKGYLVPMEQARLWSLFVYEDVPAGKAIFTATQSAKEIFLKKNDEFIGAGEIQVQKNLGETLRVVASEGADAFYTGRIGERIARDLEENDSLITKEDWETPKVVVSDPLRTDYRGYTVTSNPAPGGGVTLIEELNILEGYDLSRFDWRGLGPSAVEHVHLVASAFKAAQQDRVNLVGDPAYVDVPTERLTSKEHAAQWRERIDAGERISVPRRAPKEESSTTHLCVVDREGNAVSMTHSLASISGVVTPGLGFLYNSCMNCFDPIPGHPNSIAPGKSRVTGLSPSMVFKDGELMLVIGAPGGNMIIGGVAQGIINVLDHGMTPVEAVSAPRIECQWLDTVDVSRRIPKYVCDKVESRGHRVVKAPFDFEPFAFVQAISIDNGAIRGGSDPRYGGIALSE